MKILITITMVIVFISALFILLTGGAIFNSSFSCTFEEGKTVCEYQGLSGPALIGILIIVFFLVIDTFSIYLLITNISTT